MQLDLQIGPINRADGTTQGGIRVGRQGATCILQAHGLYFEPCSRNKLFALTLDATSGTIAAGNIVAAAAAASTQFGLINPANSTVNLVLERFTIGIISGTPPAGSVFHGFITGIANLSAASPGGVARSGLLGNIGSRAVPWASAAGAALTGVVVGPTIFRPSDFATTATAQASPSLVNATEIISGAIIIPPGVMWLPLWRGAGTTLLNSYGVTWEEVPV
jgi:hypothetical protein